MKILGKKKLKINGIMFWNCPCVEKIGGPEKGQFAFSYQLSFQEKESTQNLLLEAKSHFRSSFDYSNRSYEFGIRYTKNLHSFRWTRRSSDFRNFTSF